MKISIVTISFNQATFIRQAIESVLTQSYDDIEYIVVDAGSSDNSRSIIEQYKDRLAKIIFEPDDGPADGLNKGFAEATGDIFFYLNADDALLPNALSIVANYFANSPTLDVLYGNGLQIDEQGRPTRRIYSGKWGLRAYAFGATSIVQQATFLKKSAFIKAGGFNAANRTCWDGELLVDMARTGARFVQAPEFIGQFRVYGESITGSGRLSEQTAADMKRIAKKILNRSAKRSDIVFHTLYRIFKYRTQPNAYFAKLFDRINVSAF